MPIAHEWSALGTYAQLVVDDGMDDRAALAIAKRLVDAVDATCSRFKPDSDLSRANAAAGTWIEVDPLLVRAVEAALDAARSTDGLVDPTLGRTLAELGYDRDLDLVRAEPRVSGGTGNSLTPAAATKSRWLEVELDREGWIRVPPGCALDLGATGKAFAADLIADAVVLATGGSVVVSLGGDVASVCQDGRAAWPVLVSDTAGPGMDVAGETVLLGTGGLATSSIRHRQWRHDGAVVHHILDPRTGLPADTSVASATVQARSCVEANAATTAAVILGDAAPAWLAERGLAALLIDLDDRSTAYGGWPQAAARLSDHPTERLGVPC
jgi:thiamine biosynthesis lipoprotein